MAKDFRDKYDRGERGDYGQRNSQDRGDFGQRDKYNNRRNDNREIAKLHQGLKENDKRNSQRRLLLMARCTHVSDNGKFALALDQKTAGTGKPMYQCKICGARMGLKQIPEAELQKAIDTVVESCNFIKMMATPSKKDQDFVEDIISNLQFQMSAYLQHGYKYAVNTSKNKSNNRNDRSRNGGGNGGSGAFMMND